MEYKDKTKEQLINELAELHQRIEDLEEEATKRKQAEESLWEALKENLKEGRKKNRIESRMTKGSLDDQKRLISIKGPRVAPPVPKVIWSR